MLHLGFSGWMADFGGEYLPPDDAVYHDQSKTAVEMHNAYSEIWAKLNREAVEEVGKMDDTFIFMRSGKSEKICWHDPEPLIAKIILIVLCLYILFHVCSKVLCDLLTKKKSNSSG